MRSTSPVSELTRSRHGGPTLAVSAILLDKFAPKNMVRVHYPRQKAALVIRRGE
jgi:hypothetical protein